MPLGMEVRLGQGHSLLRGVPAPPRKGHSRFPKRGAQQPPTFRPMSIVAKRSPISATVELLFLAPPCISMYANHVNREV